MQESDFDTIRSFVDWLVSAHEHDFGSVGYLVSDIVARQTVQPLVGADSLPRYACAACGHGFTIAIESEGQESQGIMAGRCQITVEPELLLRCTHVRPSAIPLRIEACRQPDAWSLADHDVGPLVPLWILLGYNSPEAMATYERADTHESPEEGTMRDTVDEYDYDSIDDFVADLEESAQHSISVVGTLSADILRRQEADPGAMEAGQRYCCRECGWGFTVFGASDGLGYQVGASGACRIVADEALIAPCVPVDRPTMDVKVRHLIEDNPLQERVIIAFPTDRWHDGHSTD